jgi:CubicO group peptidase (beta-lactamase class C family)
MHFSLRWFVSVTVLIEFLCGGVLHADELPRAVPKDVGLSAEKLKQVGALVQTAVDENRTAGAVVLVARRGKVVYLESFGKSAVDDKVPMSSDAIFRIYSMTKPITSVAALILCDDGKLTLDDPVSKFLPEVAGLPVTAGEGDKTVKANREITVRDLLRHTSGFTYGFAGTPLDKLYLENNVLDSATTLAGMVDKLGKLPLQYQPGTRFNYSVSTDVLGRVVEVVSGKPLDEFFEERIFKPLDMRDTAFAVPDDKLPRFTSSHRSVEKGKLEVSDAAATSRFRQKPKMLSGGGGLVSTARDYARFCQMVLAGGELNGERVLRKETVREMTSNHLPPEALPMTIMGAPLPGTGFGLGVSVLMQSTVEKHGNADAGEFGWSGAASTTFWVAPKPEMFVLVLQQLEPFSFELPLAIKPAIYAAIED